METIKLSDVKSYLEDLTDSKISREQASDWATGFRKKFDEGGLFFDPVEFEDILWDAILFLEGIDLQDSPGEYLHNKEDIITFHSKLKLSSPPA